MAQETEKSWLESWLTPILIIILLIGVRGVFLAECLPPWIASPTQELGGGVITTAILGLTIHKALEYQIARNVFLAAFHYVLPDELKEEIRRIIDYRLLALDALISIKIDHAPDGLVTVETSIERTVKNMSKFPEKLRCVAGADEWGFSGFRSEVLRCEMKIDGGLMQGKCDPAHSDRKVSIGLTTEKVPLPPGKTATMVSQMREVHRDNRAMELNLPYVHIKPRVLVQVPDDINYTFDFGVPGTTRGKSQIVEEWTLEGTYFPGQRMRLRWWPRPEYMLQAAPALGTREWR